MKKQTKSKSKLSTRKSSKLPPKRKGYGIVATWVFPDNKLGGGMPAVLDDDITDALNTGDGWKHQRIMEFVDSTTQYLCEITIKPIHKVKLQKPVRPAWDSDPC